MTTHPPITGPDDPAPCPGRHKPTHPQPGAPVWCRPCQQIVLEALAALPGLYAALLDPDNARTARTEHTSTSHTATAAAAPSPSPATDTADDLLRLVCSWACSLAEHLDHRGRWYQPTHHHDGLHLYTAAAYLRRYHTAAMCFPGAIPYGHEVLAAHTAASRLLGRDQGTTDLHAPCPICDLRALVRENGTDWVACRACGLRISHADYQVRTRAFLDAS